MQRDGQAHASCRIKRTSLKVFGEVICVGYPSSRKADYSRADGIVGYAWVRALDVHLVQAASRKTVVSSREFLSSEADSSNCRYLRQT
jgi:hypothetical protein